MWESTGSYISLVWLGRGRSGGGKEKVDRVKIQSPNFLTYKEPKNRFQGTNSARLCSLAGRYDSPIPTRFLVPIDCLKILAPYSR